MVKTILELIILIIKYILSSILAMLFINWLIGNPLSHDISFFLSTIQGYFVAFMLTYKLGYYAVFFLFSSIYLFSVFFIKWAYVDFIFDLPKDIKRILKNKKKLF